jgi:hypothetical protein
MKGRPKKDTLTKHRKDAWDAFSLYIRTRDSLKTTFTIESCICCTCGVEHPRLGMGCIQAGHWIPGRNNAVLFSEEGTHGQCASCNLVEPHGKNGNPIEYWKFMERNYGRRVMDRLIEESKQIIIYKKHDYDAIAEKYKLKTERLVLQSNTLKG